MVSEILKISFRDGGEAAAEADIDDSIKRKRFRVSLNKNRSGLAASTILNLEMQVQTSDAPDKFVGRRSNLSVCRFMHYGKPVQDRSIMCVEM